MTEIVLFHHIQGLTAGVEAFAAALREAGHTVNTPDLFEGRTFGSIDEGEAFCTEVGFGEIRDRGVRAAEDLPDRLVYGGFSLGVMPAQQLTQTRPGARGGVFVYSFVPPAEFGAWPDGVPLQIHMMERDPEVLPPNEDLEAAQAMPDAELFLYPGDRHLFADNSLPDFDEAAATQLTERVLRFLDQTTG